MSATGRVAFAARAFTLAAMMSVSVILGTDVLRAAIVVLVIGVWAQVLAATGRLPGSWIALMEGAAVGVVAASTWPANDAVTPYMLVPALIGGLTAGGAGAVRVLAVEALVTATAWWMIVDRFDRGTIASVVTWLLAGLGLGILGASFRRTVVTSAADSSYRNALALIKQLHALSGKLTSGLDAVSLAEQVMEIVNAHLPISQAVVAVRRDDGADSALRFSDGADTVSLLGAFEWINEAWDSPDMIKQGDRIALPLRADDHVIAVVVGDCLGEPDTKSLRALEQALVPKAVQLHAALLFGDVRDKATSEERQRLAREVHDGIAQDVASLGYVIDNLVDMTTTDEQLNELQLLRNEVTRVVTELRHSVFDLRNETGAGQGLGQSISSFARHIGSHSDLTVHVTLDEAPTRLQPEVEAELLRIAQEAMNNARKHSAGQNMWVTCRVNPPEAHIEVRDDGNGLGHGRADSHGLRIMHERAVRIGAALEVESLRETGAGTRVSVRLSGQVPSLSEERAEMVGNK